MFRGFKIPLSEDFPFNARRPKGREHGFCEAGVVKGYTANSSQQQHPSGVKRSLFLCGKREENYCNLLTVLAGVLQGTVPAPVDLLTINLQDGTGVILISSVPRDVISFLTGGFCSAVG